ncbi:MAG: FliH/SctL family protein [Phycisphaerae bacterium]|nr:FliH/SctL family protein [Phycisphaerae bacterium]
MPDVIRREDLPAVSSFLLQDVARDAEAILANARAQASAILESARREAVTIAQTQAKRAYQSGLEEGRAAGRAAIIAEAREKTLAEQRARLSSAIDGLQSLLTALHSQRHALHATAEQGVVRLAIAIAERVCKTHVAAANDAALANMRHLLEMVRHEPRIQLHMHPDDLADARALAEAFFVRIEKNPQLRFVEDAAVGRGGCRITTREGALDATLEAQIARVAEALGIARVAPPPDEAAGHAVAGPPASTAPEPAPSGFREGVAP